MRLINKRMFCESFPILILCGMGAVLAGSIFGHMTDVFTMIPGLIVIVPGIIGLRGNINSAMGSRLSSAVHLGMVDTEKLFGTETKENITSSVVLSALISILAGVAGWATCIVLGCPSRLIYLVLTSFIAGFTSGILLSFITVGVVLIAFRRGYDPDNITGPSLATMGDVITMLCLFGSAKLVGVII